MFFCHALEVQKRELLAKGQDVSHFPMVQCFERSPGAGGVWRSDRTHEDEEVLVGPERAVVDPNTFFEEKKEEDATLLAVEAPASPGGKRMKLDDQESSSKQASTMDVKKATESTPNMYSALWTNGPKELFEFHDYTFLDHFRNVRMPTYLPRKYVLEYILNRCTKDCPDFFEKYFSFRTSVVNVKYLEGNETDCHNNMFRVETRNEITGIEEVRFFDKCIWAGGYNGIPNMPKNLVKKFKKGGFQGPIVHSSETTNFKEDVENKRVLIIGGALSAEDLALMAIKEGVSRIYCTFRSDDKEMVETTRWPYDKVETYPETTITKVEGNTITLCDVRFDVREQTYRVQKYGEKTVLEDIDTVIFCTGYAPNMNMLDESLQEVYDFCDDCDGCEDCTVTVPADWRMKSSEALEKIMGKDHKHVKPARKVYPQDIFHSVFPHLYRGSISIKNPNMMYFLLQFSSTPLMEIDIAAWMMVRYITGQRSLPSVEQMKEDNLRINLDCMDNLVYRYKMDYKFSKAVEEAVGGWDDLSEEKSNLWWAENDAQGNENFRYLGEIMNEHGYPISHLSSDGKSVSEYGKHCRKISSFENSREIMFEIEYEPADAESEQTQRPGWKTFRDAAKHDVCVSYFTGIKSCPLPKPWFELDEDDELW